MNDIRRVLGTASRRLWWVDVLRHWMVTGTAALTALLVALIVDRIAGTTLLAKVEAGADGLWQPVRNLLSLGAASPSQGEGFGAIRWSLLLTAGLPLALATLAFAAIWAYAARRREAAVARHVDEAAGLKESLSTALYIERSTDPWAGAVLETAGATARRVDVRQAVPITAPRSWPMPVAALLAFFATFVALPHFDLSGERSKQAKSQQRQDELLKVKAETNADQKKLEELVKKANVELKLDEAAEDTGDSKKPEEQDPEAFRRSAVKSLTSMAEKLQEMREGEKAPQLEALREKMQQLRQPGPGPLDDFSRQLARGDFNKAQQALEQMQKELGDASMSADKKEQLEKQLENLAKQLEKAADAQQQVQKEMEKQGIDKKTAQELAKQAAKGGDELQKAMEQMKNLSDAQKQQLMQMAMSQMKSAEQCQNMSEAMSKMAKGMSQEGMQSSEGMEGMEQLAKELSDMEMMQSDMENLDAALDEAKEQLAKLGQCLGGNANGEKDGECEGGPKIGTWKPGEGRKQGQGSGGPGRGNGPSPDAEPTDYQTVKKKADVKNVGGPTIGTRLVYGEQVKGQSTAEFADAVAAAEAQASEDITNHQVPREYQDAVKTYFGRLQQRVKKDAPAPAPAEAPKK
ncbi:MAG: hypothetical protein ACOYN0_00890 [Phycisphaerales bacterium]